MITLLGTSHVSTQSKHEVEHAIAEHDIIAIELDAGRAQGLLSEREASFSELRAALGTKAAVMAALMRSIQKRIGKSVGVMPGVEMKAALHAAHAAHKPVVLIDRDVRVTLKRLSSNFGWQEIKAMAKDMFRKRAVPIHPSDDVVEELVIEMKEQYPRIYRVMIEERDVYMSKVLIHVARQEPEKRILAIVGKGHVPGMLHQINYLNNTVGVQTWSLKPTS